MPNKRILAQSTELHANPFRKQMKIPHVQQQKSHLWIDPLTKCLIVGA